MVNEVALLESRTLRDSVAERTEALDKVKTLSLLPDGTHVTTQMVATYFEVLETAITSMVSDHREELESNGYRLATSEEVTAFKAGASVDRFTSKVSLFTRRTVLNVAMLLPHSIVARQVRTYLLDVEETQRPQPVDNFVHRLASLLDEHISLEYNADIALLVATCPFTRDALLLAARHDVTAVHRGLLEAWNNGAKLQALS